MQSAMQYTKRNTKTLLSAVMLAVSMGCLTTSTQAGEISYSYLQSSYVTLTDSSNRRDLDATGFFASASFNLFQYLAVQGSVGGISYDEINQREITRTDYALGFTGHTPVASGTDLYLNASWLEQDIEINFLNNSNVTEFDENGYGVTLGVRHRLNRNMEVGASLAQVEIFEKTDQASMELRYFIGNQFSLGVSYNVAEDVEAFLFSARINIK